jgi:hypothetical protein
MSENGSLPSPLGLTPINPDDLPATGALRGDFTYKFVQDLELKDRSLAHSLWTGAVLKNCRFVNVDFSRGDFAGAKLVDCGFNNCNFESNELRSCFLNRVSFQGCNMMGLNCVSSQFVECTILDSDLDHATFRESQLTRCDIKNTRFHRSSVTLNQFRDCLFKGILFGDATIQFLLFDCCRFENCGINAETIGYTLGLSRGDLQAFRLVYLGSEQSRPDDIELLDALRQTYVARHWYLCVCLLDINFGLRSTYLALRLYSRTLLRDVEAAPRAELDELLFLTLVMEHLDAQGALPFLGSWEIQNAVTKAFSIIDRAQPDFVTFFPAATVISSRLNQLRKKLLLVTLDQVRRLQQRSGRIELYLRLVTRPEGPLNRVIPIEYFRVCGGQIKDLELKSAEVGSWVEIWRMSLECFLAVYLVLGTLDKTWQHIANLITHGKTVVHFFRGRAEETVPANIERADPSRELANSLRAAFETPTVAGMVDRAKADLALLPPADDHAITLLDFAVKRLTDEESKELRLFLQYTGGQLEEARVTFIEERHVR